MELNLFEQESILPKIRMQVEIFSIVGLTPHIEQIQNYLQLKGIALTKERLIDIVMSDFELCEKVAFDEKHN